VTDHRREVAFGKEAVANDMKLSSRFDSHKANQRLYIWDCDWGGNCVLALIVFSLRCAPIFLGKNISFEVFVLDAFFVMARRACLLRTDALDCETAPLIPLRNS
jgi:hypothetical protein